MQDIQRTAHSPKAQSPVNQRLGIDKPHYFIISHTHWDREWYLCFEHFRRKLVKLIDNLLDLLDSDPEFVCFHLDGQTIVIEDYLEIRPENRDKLMRYIEQERLIVGPWYVQNDLFLTSGESTVRSLMEGISTARGIHREMKVGYLPDHFGLIGQMPQIFSQVGINNAVFGRGYNADAHGGHNFLWEGVDGTRVTAAHLPCWYNNAQRLPEDTEDLLKTYAMIKQGLEGTSPVSVYLMMNGVDHLEAQENLSAIVQSLQQAEGENARVIHGYMEDYIDLLKEHMRACPDAYPVVRGELREGADNSSLAGTLSSRRYIKQANMRASDLMEKWLEPLLSFAHMADLQSYDTGYMRYLWKTCMQNHPHDSICGCSLDVVHDDMLERYRHIDQAGGALLEDTLECLTRQMDMSDMHRDDRKMAIFNASQRPSDTVIQTDIHFLKEERVAEFTLLDSNGIPVTYEIVDYQTVRLSRNSPINLPQVLEADCYTIRWRPKVPAMGYTCYTVRPYEAGETVGVVRDDVRTLENDRLRLDFRNNGRFDMLDKTSGRLLIDQCAFEEIGDRGQMYVFDPAGESRIFDGFVRFQERTVTPLYQELSYTFEWELPARLSENFESRSKETALSAFEVRVRLENDSNRADIFLQVDNRSCDHRLRVLFGLDKASTQIRAGGQYDVVVRPYREQPEPERKSRVQPFWKLVNPCDDRGDGLFVMAHGICEYEMTDPHTLAVTLLRGVEGINNRELPRLPVDRQIKSQCLGEGDYHFVVGPSSGTQTATALYQEAEYHHQGLRAVVLPVDDTRWQIGRPWVQDSTISAQFVRPTGNEHKPFLPKKGLFLTMSHNLMLSSWKLAEDKSGCILRLYNVEDKTVRENICLPEGYCAQEVNLLEEPTGMSYLESEIVLTVNPKKIVTLKISG